MIPYSTGAAVCDFVCPSQKLSGPEDVRYFPQCVVSEFVSRDHMQHFRTLGQPLMGKGVGKETEKKKNGREKRLLICYQQF